MEQLADHFETQAALSRDLNRARAQTDQLFELIAPSALLERPITERHRIIFYIGHLETFDWNLIGRRAYDLPSFNSEFDHLFAFGIDPTDGRNPDDKPSDWPSIDRVRGYTQRLRRQVDDCLDRGDHHADLFFRVAIEHRLMHAETLAYMMHWLPFEHKRGQPPSYGEHDEIAPPREAMIPIPQGQARLGLEISDRFPFGWDNEFQPHHVDVPEFAIDRHNVTNAQFKEFVLAGGYEEPSLWDEPSWRWVKDEGIMHPRFWLKFGEQWLYRTMFADIPMPGSWPVYVSHAEATAYARWRGKALPTEAQYHRAAFGTPGGQEQLYPWGSDHPGRQHGNFDFRRWSPSPVGAYPEGNSAFGVADLVGNGWEWTSTPFSPFEGFKPFPFYPGYSADFFDGRHFVLKGASPRTSALLVRRSFRNWFQPHYPNIYATFRCVEN
jgi:gamma-glutamyl hercynylcysteine S-oxide synthase